jgi:hypothetical protein
MIRFMQFFVQNTETGAKAKVWYSIDNQKYDPTEKKLIDLPSVTIYADTYGRQLYPVFKGEKCTVENKTEIMTDYFEKDRITLYEDSPLYKAARERAEINKAKRDAKYKR